MTEPCTSESCHAWRTYGFAHTHPSDTAAGTRALISRLESLNDDGTPTKPVGMGQEIAGGWVDEVQNFAAPPTQEDSPALFAEQGTTRRGRFDVSPVPETQRRVLSNYMQQAENSTGYLDALLGIDRSDHEQMAAIDLVALERDLKEMEQSDPAVRKAAERLQEALDRIRMNIHQVYVSKNALNCTISCAGPLPHVHEYRAADVRPSTAQTARNNAADANKMPDSNNTNPA